MGHDNIAGVVLAGGLSSRMGGGDKCLLPLGEGRLIDHVLDRLRPQVGLIAINANGDSTRFGEFELPVIADTVEGFAGPLAGVLAAMRWANGLGFDQVVTVAGDTPFFPKNLVSRLAKEGGGNPIAMAFSQTDRGMSRHPTFALWDVALADPLEAALLDGLRKVVLFTDAQGCGRVEFTSDPFDPFFNINTPDDRDKGEALIKDHQL